MDSSSAMSQVPLMRSIGNCWSPPAPGTLPQPPDRSPAARLGSASQTATTSACRVNFW
jgi:hypothetical protein